MAVTPDLLALRLTFSRSAPSRRAAAPARGALVASAALWVFGCTGSKPPAAATAPRADARAPAPAMVKAAAEPEEPAPKGPLSKQAIESIIQARSDRFQPCYDVGLRKDPALQGRVMARITIGNDGRVAASEDAGSSMPDESVVQCVLAGFKKLRFPLPEESYVTVVYPMQFDLEPGNAAAASKGTAHADAPSMLKTGPFRGCSLAKGSSSDESGTTTEIECGSKKLVVTDVPAQASIKAAQGHLRRFEESASSSMRPKRSSMNLQGKAGWVTVVQEQGGKSWGTMVVLSFGKEKTRVVECSGKLVGISRWCERHISSLAKGYSPTGLLYGPGSPVEGSDAPSRP
jgi:hypothetical protein